MVAAWFEATPDGVLEEIHMRQYDGSQWSDVMVVSDTTTERNRYAHAAVDANDNIYIVWRPYPQSGGTYLLIKKKAWTDTSWPMHADTVAAQGQIVARPTMVIDDNDNLFVAYQRDIPADTLYSMDEIAVVASSDGGATWTEPLTLSRPDHDAGYQGMDPRVTSSGIDLTWRESYAINQNDPDSSSIVYGRVELSIVGLELVQDQIVDKFQLNQNYPNPFNPSTEITFNIAKPGKYELSIYNVLGQKIKTLAAKKFESGQKSVSWNGLNELGNQVSSGVYFYKLSYGDYTLTKKLVFLK
jgi:hypothetical protein